MAASPPGQELSDWSRATVNCPSSFFYLPYPFFSLLLSFSSLL
jgi:hypothetical protein